MENLAQQWVRLAWYVPIGWSEFLGLSRSVRMQMFLALNDIKRELDGSGGGNVTGQPRGDRKMGYE